MPNKNLKLRVGKTGPRRKKPQKPRPVVINAGAVIDATTRIVTEALEKLPPDAALAHIDGAWIDTTLYIFAHGLVQAGRMKGVDAKIGELAALVGTASLQAREAYKPRLIVVP